MSEEEKKKTEQYPAYKVRGKEEWTLSQSLKMQALRREGKKEQRDLEALRHFTAAARTRSNP